MSSSKTEIIAGTLEAVPGVPSHVKIYQVNCSPFWWTRCFVNKKYVVRSTGVLVKGGNKRDAYSFAKEVFTDALVNLKANPRSKTKSRSFAVLASSLVELEKTTAKSTLYKNDKGKVEGFLIPYFKNKNIDEIEYSDLVEMLSELNQKNLAPATKKHYLSLVSKIFKYAVQEGVLKVIPVFPKLSERLKTTEKRDYLTKGEYTTLNKTAIKMAQEGVKVRGVEFTKEMHLLNKFMVNSFLRPTDIKVLKHKHILYREGVDENDEEIKWLTLRHPATKTTAYEVQTMPPAVDVYKELITFRKEDHKNKKRLAELISKSDKNVKDKRQKALDELKDYPYLDPDDFVFFPRYKNRNTMIATWSRLFRELVKQSRLEQKTGKNIQLYSLRHTSIMFRLMFGNVDTLLLAKNARTSQGVIEQFYGSHLTTDQSRKQLHSFIDKDKNKTKDFDEEPND